jgi:uncharacterized protein YbjT (DUF2867 family)
MKIAVTGAFGYSGRYIAQHLLNAGHTVMTLTNSVLRENPFGARVQTFPFHFDQPARLRESLMGVEALINTYWVRFDHRDFSYNQAVANTNILFQAAKEAGVHRIVHVSITNPDLNSDLAYFRGKAELESALKALGVSHCILRPTVLFGQEDVLINNIAWALRHLPFFGVFGRGDCKLQPIFVGDLAAIAATKAVVKSNQVVNAIGPETFTYRQLVETIQRALGLSRWIVSVPPELGYWGCRLLGLMLRDIVITRQEIRGLMENRLCVDAPPLGITRFSDWIQAHRETLGRNYTSEMARRVDRSSAYRSC